MENVIIRVNYPMSKEKNNKEYFEVEDGIFAIGDIVVVESEVTDTYGVVVKVNMNTKRDVNNKVIRVAGTLDRVLFWQDFEQFILNNKLRFGKLALEKYQQTKKNGELTYNELVNKMKRNLLLIHHPYRINVSKNGSFRFNYGYLQITYNNGTIHYVENNKAFPKGWKKDWHKHWYYSKILNVEFD